jgi:hypothetical protein
MGLPVRQRRVLDHIDRALRGSDPRLAALYAIFGRLAQEEPIPRFEQLRSGLLAWLAGLGVILAAIARHLHIRLGRRRRARVRNRAAVRHRAGVRHRAEVRHRAGVRRPVGATRPARAKRMLRLRPRQRAILLYPLAIALAIGSIVLAARSSPDKGCLSVRAVAAAKHVARSSLCRPPGNLSPVMYGH